MNRWRGHGAVQVYPPKDFKAEMRWVEQGFGLGYRDDSGTFKGQFCSEISEFQEFNHAEAFWQLRINDLITCISKTHLPARPTLS